MMATHARTIPVLHNGRRFRSRTDARWAVFLEVAGLRYEYEPEELDLAGERHRPAFWLPDIGYWLEASAGEPSEDQIEQSRRLAEATGKIVLLAIGAPAPADQIIPVWPNGRLGLFGDHDDLEELSRCHFADDRRNEGEFWLASERGGRSIGPVNGPNHLRDPLVHRETMRGYEAASGARFQNATGDDAPANAINDLDRTVTLDRSSPHYQKVMDSLAQLAELVRSNNQYAASEPLDHEQRLAEVEGGRQVLKAARARVRVVWELVVKGLKYLAAKFADHAIGIIASAALTALAALFGLSL